MNQNEIITNNALDLIKYYYEKIFPTIYGYITKLYILGIDEYPEQLDYYKNDTFLVI